ncbi:hypothetical protein D3C87_1257410 [compost metagenome]
MDNWLPIAGDSRGMREPLKLNKNLIKMWITIFVWSGCQMEVNHILLLTGRVLSQKNAKACFLLILKQVMLLITILYMENQWMTSFQDIVDCQEKHRSCLCGVLVSGKVGNAIKHKLKLKA